MQYRIFRCLSSKRNYLDSSAHRAENLDSKWPRYEKSESAKNGKPAFVSFTASNQQELHSLLSNKYSYHSIKFSANPNQYPLSSIFQILKIRKYEASFTPNMDFTQLSGSPAITSEQLISHNSELSFSKLIPSSPEIISAFLQKFNFDTTKLDAKYCKESSSESGSMKRKENHDSLSILEPKSPGFSIIWSTIIYHIVNFTIIWSIYAIKNSNLAHEQQYHLLTAADESVGARPSSC